MGDTDVKKASIIAFSCGFLFCLIIGVSLSRCTSDKPSQVVKIERDTVVLIDTVRDTVPQYIHRYIVRVDTVMLRDTSGRDVPGLLLPIERRVYKTVDYRAVISGHAPVLESIDVYRHTVRSFERQTVTVFKPPPRWALTVGVGAGAGTRGFDYGMYLTAGYVIWAK